MKVKDLLEIQGIIDNRIIPNDMNDNKLNEHYSESKGEFMSILDMDLIHLVRSYNKTLSHREEYPDEDVYDCINDIEKKVSELRKLL
jgi:hypothetical protein|tara:strand:- start:96 stop:356 length:261 start_codon:yes stop_codon:yes gene_type:complete